MVSGSDPPPLLEGGGQSPTCPAPSGLWGGMAPAQPPSGGGSSPTRQVAQNLQKKALNLASDPPVSVEGRDCGRPYHCAVIGGFRGVTVLALRRTPAASLRTSDPSLMHHDAIRPSGLGTWWSGRTSWSGHIRVIAHKYHSPPRTSSARSHLEITTQFAGLQCALSNSVQVFRQW